MEKLDAALEESGLSPGEARVYLALLRLGSATTGPIAGRAGVSSGKVYAILDRLLRKGLASSVVRNKTRHYAAADPALLAGYVREREEALRKTEERLAALVPEFRAFRQKSEYSVQMFFGLAGIRSAAEQALEELPPGGEVLALGVRGEKGEEFNRFWLKWHRQRIRKRSPCRLIFTDRAGLYQTHRHMPLTKVRAVQSIYPATIDVMGDNVLLLTYDRNPACALVTNREIADSFRQFFDSLWSLAKP
jgi:predicted transcriptional regulator